MEATPKEHQLQVRNLCVSFVAQKKNAAAVQVVRDVSFELYAGETLGIIGESGCGKSITAASLLRLTPRPVSSIDSGQVLFEGIDLLQLPLAAVQEIRGKRIAMISQDPTASLNPVLSIRRQLSEARAHRGDPIAAEELEQVLRDVGLHDTARILASYPHQLSGGMCQRVMIAMALAGNPDLLIADEPTTALDLTIQAQVLNVLKELQRKRKLSVLLISHDLGVIAHMCDRVLVMYAGRLVECGSVADIFHRPLHPYTAGLLSSFPSGGTPRKSRLPIITGSVPQFSRLPPGCAFANRCPSAQELCSQSNPALPQTDEHTAACHFPQQY